MIKYIKIGDKIVDSESMRMGTIVDLVEELDADGNMTYQSAKIDFSNGDIDWISGDRVTKLLLETGE